MADQPQENSEPKDSNHNKKAICNRCLSEVTGIPDFDTDDEDDIDLGEIFAHLEFCLSKVHEKIINNEKSMALLFKSYVLNDVDIIKEILGIAGICTCDEHDDEDEDD